MKILLVLLILFALIFISSKPHVEGRGLKEDNSMFTSQTNRDKKNPLAENDVKVVLDDNGTKQNEKKVVDSESNLVSEATTSAINKVLKDDDDDNDDSGGDSSIDGSHHQPTVQWYCDRISSIHTNIPCN